MSGTPLRDHIEETPDGATLRSNGIPLIDVERRLETSETLDQVRVDFGLSPAELVASIAYLGLGPDGTAEIPLIQALPMRSRFVELLSERSLSQILPGADRPGRLALSAGLLQIHDHWHASHEAAQEADDLGEHAYAPYWHGIAHRREPDAGNASYWFRRVGRHAVYAKLATAVEPILDDYGDMSLKEKLIQGSSWNSFNFIDLCTRARKGTPLEALLRRLQKVEMALLLDATASAVLPAKGRGARF